MASRHSVDSCLFQLHSWKPFHIQPAPDQPDPPPKPYSLPKRRCLSDRATSFPSADSIDLSRLSLIDDDKSVATAAASPYRPGSFRLLARKRRRRGSRSVSGRSSDRSGTTLRCCASAAQGTCSDFPAAAATDSSGELFGNSTGDANWASDASEVRVSSRREKEERESLVAGQFSNLEGNESGYGSEPGYRGDAEFGYGDEIDEEEDDARLLFWADSWGDDTDVKMEMVGENTFSDQKAHHHRCRRKKHDLRMVDASR
ncbi:hypothetical protein Tsubulata_031719 [Turnera subulata]|uniref:Uncharacterized protein n=1 Tax=Turnera subulata TaxID=218843 RepID=A0A9Q0J678_9ROSI|nr:hypothetical protein Tsubulata_031719 [Turnera subulata]